MRVAVIGSGIAGLAAAHALDGHARVTLFEAGRNFGGHAHTVDMALGGVSHGVDMGFLVFNHRTYPGLVRLFDQLKVQTAPSEMSFSVQVTESGGERLEWGGAGLGSVFCQPRNLAHPAFLRMLSQLLRFNRVGTAAARAGLPATLTLRAFLDQHGFGPELRDWYLLPMVACIWSCPPEAMLDFPAATLLRFCDNHGLLQVSGRPQWRTVAGGSREYVRRIVRGIPDARLGTPVRQVRRTAGGVVVATDRGSEAFDRAVIATHPGEALGMLADATAAERAVLGAIRYQRNRAVLHTDASMLPASRRAWSAWNCERSAGGGEARVCLHYLINKLQPLPWKQPVVVSLNPVREIDPRLVAFEREFDHPVFDARAVEAQRRLASIASSPVWFCGAWAGHGFHEDGLQSGYAAAARVLASLRSGNERLAA